MVVIFKYSYGLQFKDIAIDRKTALFKLYKEYKNKYSSSGNVNSWYTKVNWRDCYLISKMEA